MAGARFHSRKSRAWRVWLVNLRNPSSLPVTLDGLLILTPCAVNIEIAIDPDGTDTAPSMLELHTGCT